MKSSIDFLYILTTILCTVYGQLVVKWQVRNAGALPLGINNRIYFLLKLLFNPWILSGLAAALVAMFAWMAAMTKFELSYAYPFTSLGFVIVLVLSALLFHEAMTIPKVLGVGLVVVGLVVASHG
jgi:multidrug transporter EmrE-like cation transporter